MMSLTVSSMHGYYSLFCEGHGLIECGQPQNRPKPFDCEYINNGNLCFAKKWINCTNDFNIFIPSCVEVQQGHWIRNSDQPYQCLGLAGNVV